MYFVFRFYIVSIFMLGPTQLLAEKAFGPSTSMEYSGAVERDDKKGGLRSADSARIRFSAELFYPIEASSLNSTFYPLFTYSHEIRKAENPPSTGIDLPESMASAGYGIANVYHLADYDLTGMMMIYDSFRSSDPNTKMWEAIAGADVKKLSLFGLSDQKLTLLVRYRHYRHATRWLPLIYYKFKAGDYDIDIRLPSRVIVGRDFYNGNLTLFGGASLHAADYPLYIETEAAWTEGYVSTIFIGTRFRLSGVVFLELRGGVWSDTMEVYAEDRQLIEYSSNFQPWVRLAIQTVVEK